MALHKWLEDRRIGTQKRKETVWFLTRVIAVTVSLSLLSLFTWVIFFSEKYL